MINSPPIRIGNDELGIIPPSKLHYLAQLFRGAKAAFPASYIELTGDAMVGGKAVQQLGMLGVNARSVRRTVDRHPQFAGAVEASIYYLRKQGQRFVKVKLEAEHEPPVEVEFEVSEDGTMLKEASVSWDSPLKATLANAGRNVKTVTVKTSVELVGEFERDETMRLQTALKGKFKGALSAELRPSPQAKTVEVSFEVSAGASHDFHKHESEAEAEISLSLKIPFNFF